MRSSSEASVPACGCSAGGERSVQAAGISERPSVRHNENQLKPPAAAHPADQLERAALQRMTCPHDPHPLREAIEVCSVSCLPSEI